jgi:peptidoglycan/LPS O-acetylase OafA/YrhL
VRFLIDPALERLGVQENVWAWFGLYIPVVLFLSTLTYHFFEKPARDGLRRLLDPKDRREPKVAEVTF